MYAARHIRARIYAADRAGRRYKARLLGNRIIYLNPRMVHCCIGAVNHLTVAQQVFGLDHILRHIEDSKTVLLILAVGNQRNDNFRNGYTRYSDDADNRVFQERLDAGALGRAAVDADKYTCVDRGERTIRTARQRDRTARLAFAQNRGNRIDQFVVVAQLNRHQIAAGHAARQIIVRQRIERKAGVILGLTIRADGNIHLQRVDHRLGYDADIYRIACERTLKGNRVIKYRGNAVDLACELDQIAFAKACNRLGDIHRIAFLGDQLHLAAVGACKRYTDTVAPAAFIGCGHLEDTLLRRSDRCVLRNNTRNVAAGAAVGEELLNAVSKITVFPVGIFAQIAAKLPHEIGKACDKARRADRRALDRHTDKAGGRRTDALNRAGRGVIFLYIYTGR